MVLNSIFGKKENSAELPPEQKEGIFVRVMQGEYQRVDFGRFDISVSAAINAVLKELKLPDKLDNELLIKYFLYRKSVFTGDGLEIIAEVNGEGQPLMLYHYGIENNAQLMLGAVVVKKDAEAELQSHHEEDETYIENRTFYPPDYDDEVVEV